jgi:alginate O-acetyltransferase complex protein AlgI
VTFTTPVFLVFLTIVFGLYWFLPRKGQNLLLLAASLIFYGWWDWRFLLLLIGAAMIDYFAALGIAASESEKRRKWLLRLSLLGNLGTLAFFKYFSFFVDSMVSLIRSFGVPAEPWALRLILPVGISFYTFQALSYTIDVYRRRMQPVHDPVVYMGFITFFPQLVAGPIERATQLLGQFEQNRKFLPAEAVDGCRQMLWGFFKKLVIADNLALIVNEAYSDPAAASGSVLLWATYAFAFQIYCDFSGYTDIAIGCARLFGFRLMRNFAYPYFARDIVEFWRRWHISLSTWFRDYLYIPLGGNRVGPIRRKFNILAVFVVSGFWHGANWTFLVWGAIHGVFYLLLGGSRNQEGREESASLNMRDLASIVLTFHVVCLAWIFFRANSLAQAAEVVAKIASSLAGGQVGRPPSVMLLGLVVLLVCCEWLQRKRMHPLDLMDFPKPVRWVTYYATVGLIVTFAKIGYTPFIYFQF